MLLAGVSWAAPIEPKPSQLVAENTPRGGKAIRFKALVAERSVGEFMMSVYPSFQLFGDNKVLEARLPRDAQMAASSLSSLQKHCGSLQALDLALLFRDRPPSFEFSKALNVGDAQRAQRVENMRPVWGQFSKDIGPDVIGLRSSQTNYSETHKEREIC